MWSVSVEDEKPLLLILGVYDESESSAVRLCEHPINSFMTQLQVREDG
jgi:hypothetical protein